MVVTMNPAAVQADDVPSPGDDAINVWVDDDNYDQEGRYVVVAPIYRIHQDQHYVELFFDAYQKQLKMALDITAEATAVPGCDEFEAGEITDDFTLVTCDSDQDCYHLKSECHRNECRANTLGQDDGTGLDHYGYKSHEAFWNSCQVGPRDDLSPEFAIVVACMDREDGELLQNKGFDLDGFLGLSPDDNSFPNQL
jgi:hypothetical protein